MANWQQKLALNTIGIKGIDRNTADLVIRIDSLDDFFGTSNPGWCYCCREVHRIPGVQSDLSDGADTRHNRQYGIRRHKDNGRAANVPLRSVAPFPLVGLDRQQTYRNNRRQAESTLPHACPVFNRTKGAKPDNPESGALSHSRAAANVPLRGVAPFPLVGLDRVAP